MKIHSFIFLAVVASGVFAGDGKRTENSAVLERVAYIVMSQLGHEERSQITVKSLRDGLSAAGVDFPQISVLNSDLPGHGGWTVFPILKNLDEEYDDVVDWYLFLDEDAGIRPDILAETLKKYKNGRFFVGRALQDSESVITHHFDTNLKFKYPDFAASFLLSKNLLHDLANHLEKHEFKVRDFPDDFSIDPQYEFAKTLHGMDVDDSDEEPVELTDDSGFCVDEKGENCATFKRQIQCPKEVDEKEVLFAVKTCKKYHSDRLPIIRETWAKAAANVEYFSEKNSKEFQTKVLPDITGNTLRGHCMKTMAIMKYFNQKAYGKGWKWLVIADDDTILSVKKIYRLLGCYEKIMPVCIGQRYGYKISTGITGYDYPTGGAGMIFNRQMVNEIAESEYCECPQDDTPDDMHIGACLSTLGHTMIHNSGLHQGRVEDYPQRLLQGQYPISFHKFWETDARKTYKRFFEPHDKDLIKGTKDEL